MKVGALTGKALAKKGQHSDSVLYQEGDGYLNDLRLESFGHLLADYILKGAEITWDKEDEKLFVLTEGIISFGDQLWRSYNSQFRLSEINATYHIGFITGKGYVCVVTKPVKDYLPLWEVGTDLNGAVSLIKDLRGEIGRVKYKAIYEGVYLNTAEVQKSIDDAIEAALSANNAASDVQGAVMAAESAALKAEESANNANAVIDEVRNSVADTIDVIDLANQTIDLANETIINADSAIERTTIATNDAVSATDESRTATTQAITVTTNAQKLLDNTKSAGLFSIGVAYKKNNTVRYNGSTFSAKVDTQNNPLPVLPIEENTWWILVAQRGIDGKGSVSSVNGVLPDISGNVELEDLAKESEVSERLEGKVSKIAGKQLSTEDYSTIDKNKVTGIEDEANKYIHPLTHPAIMIEQDPLRRMVSDEKISLWDASEENANQYTDEKVQRVNDELNDGESIPVILNRGPQTLNAERDSTVQVVSLPGKTVVNPIVLLDSGLWTFHANVTVNSPSKATLVATADHQFSSIPQGQAIPVKTNTVYTLSSKHNGKIAVIDLTGNAEIASATTAQSVTFNTGSNTLIRPLFTNKGLGNGTFTFENIMLNEGTTAKEFVANVKGITNPTITANNKSLTLMDTFHEGDTVSVDGNGQARVNRKRREIVLDGSLPWSYSSNYTGFKKVRLNQSISSIQGTEVIVKYNGGILKHTEAWTGADMHFLAPNNWLDITIANTDSGWGQTYTPTADEIKAYFLGWKMYESTSPDGSGVYNGTGTKVWGYRHDSGLITSGTFTLPTTQAPINSKWQPYRLIYELATPIIESVRTIGSISFKKGDNVVEVSEGRIVRERANPITDNAYYYINAIIGGNSAYTKHKSKTIGNIYRNGEVDTNWAIDNRETYNGSLALIPNHLFDPTAIYEVEYIPQEPYKVSAHTNPITIEYQETIGAVTDQLVDDVTGLTTRMNSNEKVMSEIITGKSPAYALKKQEDWINAVLQNGWSGTLQYAKNDLGQVSVVIGATSGVVAALTIIATLPVGYRPNASVAIQAINTSGSSGKSIAYIHANGNIYLVSDSNFVNGAYYNGQITFIAGG